MKGAKLSHFYKTHWLQIKKMTFFLMERVMNCFLVEIRFLKPFASFGATLNRHRVYLQKGYDQGLILMSGPRADQTGGVCIARAVDEDALREFFVHDPYALEKLAEYVIIPFSAAKYQPFLAPWIQREA